MLVKQISPRVSFVTSSRDLQYDAAEDTLWITWTGINPFQHMLNCIYARALHISYSIQSDS